MSTGAPISESVVLEPSAFFEALAAFRRSFAWSDSLPACAIPDLGDHAATADLEMALSLLFRTRVNTAGQLEFGARAATLTAGAAIHSDRVEASVTSPVTTTSVPTTVPTVTAPPSSQGGESGAEDSAGEPAPAPTGPPSSLDVLSQDPEQAP